MPELFNVLTVEQANARLAEHLAPLQRVERLSVMDALDRVTAEELRAPVDLPAFARSTMDGFAVRAADTYGASEGLPAYLAVCGEVPMGRAAGYRGPRGRGGARPHRRDAAARRRRGRDGREYPGARRSHDRGGAAGRGGRECHPGRRGCACGRPAVPARPPPAPAGPGRAGGRRHHERWRWPRARAWRSWRPATRSCRPSSSRCPGRCATSTPTRSPR